MPSDSHTASRMWNVLWGFVSIVEYCDFGKASIGIQHTFPLMQMISIDRLAKCELEILHCKVTRARCSWTSRFNLCWNFTILISYHCRTLWNEPIKSAKWSNIKFIDFLPHVELASRACHCVWCERPSKNRTNLLRISFFARVLFGLATAFGGYF